MLFLLVLGDCFSQTKDSLAIQYAETITKTELNEHLSILASDEFEGRETGEKGEHLAADYLVAQFKNDSLPAINAGSYFQEFPLEKYKQAGTAGVNGRAYSFIEDFVYFNAFGNEFQIEDLVFGGFGVESEKYNDFENIDVKGKNVLVMAGEPVDKEGNSYLSGNKFAYNTQKDIFGKMNLAEKKGIKRLFIVLDNFTERIGRYVHYFNGMKMGLKGSHRKNSDKTMIFVISKTMADEMFVSSKKSLDQLKTKINKKGKPHSFELTTSVTINTMSEMDEAVGKNVLGYIEGSDLKDELIVITAHYDHLGKQGSLIYNGADDDGSGTVGLIEIAEAFTLAKAAGHGPRRSVLIMPVSGEEKGLLGSRYYSENPIFPLENTITNLNIDMIGRVDEDHADNPNYVYLIGSDMLSTDLHDISEWANSTYVGLDLDYRFNSKDDPNQFYTRSDHYNFARNNIPVIFYFNGTHDDYHQSTDTIEKIDFERLEIRTKLVFFTAWHLANQDERPKLNVEEK